MQTNFKFEDLGKGQTIHISRNIPKDLFLLSNDEIIELAESIRNDFIEATKNFLRLL